MSVPTSNEGVPSGFRRYVVGFMFNNVVEPVEGKYNDGIGNEMVLLIEKTKPAWQKGKLNGIGGKIEEGEEPLEAMVREFREETGMRTAPADWTFNIHLSGPDYEVFFYSARGPIVQAIKTTEESPHVIAVKHLPFNTIYNLRWMIPLVLDKSISFPLIMSDRIASADASGINK